MRDIQKQIKQLKTITYQLLYGNDRRSDLLEYAIDAAICLNVVLIIAESMGINGSRSAMIAFLRNFFFVFFLAEYLAKLWVADLLPQSKRHPLGARLRYILSFSAIIDFLALLPVLLDGTFVDFRIFRTMRLLRITQIKSLKRYTDILISVFRLKGVQLLSSLFIVFVFILVSSVIIYDLEGAAQPEVFSNVLSGIWWSISAVTTVGYGDMYPVTPWGRVFGAFMSIFGIFLMAVPIGILTSGFFEIAKEDKEV